MPPQRAATGAEVASRPALSVLETNSFPSNGRSKRSGNVKKRSKPPVASDGEDENEFSDGNVVVDVLGKQKRHFEDEESGDDEGYLEPLVCSDEDGEGSSRKSISLDEAIGLEPKKVKAEMGTATPKRRRRRSSARFLRLSGRFDSENGCDDGGQLAGGAGSGGGTNEQEQLGEMYRQAIRMNAENRINAGNSWNLRLIENIDKFLGDDDDDDDDNHQTGGRSGKRNGGRAGRTAEEPLEIDKERKINFTKASCTLDASVKIYSYRVEDVYLSSYKVLANLNRTDAGGKKKVNGSDEQGEVAEDGGGPSSLSTRKQSDKRGTTETLETNVSNLNMSKVDSAYDIDPLFHKMSKKFDEGGAKGLLLANLGVSEKGCAIVFDSKEDSVAEPETDDLSDVRSLNDADNNTADDSEHNKEGVSNINHKEGMVDISALSNKLGSCLSGLTVDSLPLVPQLALLREEFVKLEADGFVDDKKAEPKSKRYANSEEEEKEAEKSIHREALERSRASIGNNTFAASLADDGDGYGADDFGGGDDDDNHDTGFDDFIAMDDNGSRYSSISFRKESFSEDALPGATTPRQTTAAILDALCTGDVFTGEGKYEYFDASTLEKITTGNLWAGSSHWKRSTKIRRKREKLTKPKRKKAAKDRQFVELSASTSSVQKLLMDTATSKKGSDPLHLTKAAKLKQRKNDNLLPPDAGIGIEQLSCFFLRPNATVRPVGRDFKDSRKSVGFHNMESFPMMGFDGGDNDSFGDGGDDGPGFDFIEPDENFSEKDDFVMENLEGVRKVNKVEVGYAKVAKKVDVKRLKKELWAELEVRTNPAAVESEDHDDIASDANKDQNAAGLQNPINSSDKSVLSGQTSFQDTVRELASTQAQGDVSLAFYFICLLHLANEKGLKLDSTGMGLSDFIITRDDGSAPSFGELPTAEEKVDSSTTRAAQRTKRNVDVSSYNEEGSSCDEGEESEDN